MKKSILSLGVIYALLATGFAQVPADKAAEGVIMKRGTFWSTYEVEGKFYYLGDWFQESLPSNPTELEAVFLPHQSTPEENLQNLFSGYGVTTPEEYAAAQGYGQGDPDTLLAAYGTWNALAEQYGFSTYEEWVNAWWGQDPGYNTIARWWGYTIPNTGDVAAMLNDYGYATIQDMANAWYSQSIPPSISQSQINEIAVRMTELPPSTLASLLENSPAANTKENLLALQQALMENLNSGALATAGWTEADLQTPLWEIFSQSAITSNNPDGSFLAQMDFSALDLTGQSLNNLSLKGSNITGAQINSAASVQTANLSGLDLTGLSLIGKSASGTNFAGSTGITGTQIVQQATDIKYSNLSGLDFTGASLAGKSIQGTTITNPSHLAGSQLNGVTGVQGAKLEGMDLSTWTTIPYTGDWQSSVTSLAGSTLNNAIMNNQVSRQADLTGCDLGFWQPNGIFGVDLDGVKNFTGANIKGHIYWGTSMGTIDMTGYNYTGRVIAGDFRNVKNMTGTQLNGLISLIHDNIFTTNLSGRDLTGWVPTYNIKGANLSNTTGYTAASLAGATNILNINLQGTGITKAQLDAALTAAGKNPTTGNFNTSTISF